MAGVRVTVVVVMVVWVAEVELVDVRAQGLRLTEPERRCGKAANTSQRKKKNMFVNNAVVAKGKI